MKRSLPDIETHLPPWKMEIFDILLMRELRINGWSLLKFDFLVIMLYSTVYSTAFSMWIHFVAVRSVGLPCGRQGCVRESRVNWKQHKSQCNRAIKRKPTLSTSTCQLDCCNTFPLLPEVGTKNVSTLLSIFVALIAFDVRVANALKAGTKKLQKQS